MEASEQAVGAMQAYLRLKRYILPSGIARESLQAAVPFLSALEPSAARQLALEEILREVDEIERKVWAWSGSAFLNNELEGAEDADCKTELYRELCGIGNTMHWLRTKICALSSPDHANADKVHEYVQGYEFRADNGGGYTPTDGERTMIEDAIQGFISDAGKVEGDGWLPIESAPKEGGFLAANSTEVWAAWHYDSPNWHARYGSRGATHWRPLPSAPASEGAE